MSYNTLVSMGLVLYARKEPTTDDVLKKYAPNAKRYDVCLYKDEAATELYARYTWFSTPKPNKRTKTVSLNSVRWALIWLEDKKHERNN